MHCTTAAAQQTVAIIHYPTKQSVKGRQAESNCECDEFTAHAAALFPATVSAEQSLFVKAQSKQTALFISSVSINPFCPAYILHVMQTLYAFSRTLMNINKQTETRRLKHSSVGRRSTVNYAITLVGSVFPAQDSGLICKRSRCGGWLLCKRIHVASSAVLVQVSLCGYRISSKFRNLFALIRDVGLVHFAWCSPVVRFTWPCSASLGTSANWDKLMFVGCEQYEIIMQKFFSRS